MSGRAVIEGLPRAPRIPGESDTAYDHFREWIYSGGIREDGSLAHRTSFAETARRRGVRPEWIRELAGRHDWKARAVEWDNAALEFIGRAARRRNDWSALLALTVEEIERRGTGGLSGSELATLARLAATQLEREREAGFRPLDLDGVDLERLSLDEREALVALLEKAAA